MTDPIQVLKSMKKEHDFFVGIDSDGCAFDTMEVKHKYCFVVAVLHAFGLAALARILRDVWDFVNLNGQTRGCNRWLALRETFRYLMELSPYERFDGPLRAHLDVIEQFIHAADQTPEITLSNEGLVRFAETKLDGRARKLLKTIVAEPVSLANSPQGRELVGANTDADHCLLRLALWTHLVNGMVAIRVHDVPPFPHVRESLQKVAAKADVMVVSATPGEALQREWVEHDIAQYARLICGQEMGKKAEHLKYGAGGKYDPDKVLMVGDAPGDMKAAKANNALFYPVMLGDEAASWQRFYEEAADRFLAGTYGGKYEQDLIAAFDASLPKTPPWKKP